MHINLILKNEKESKTNRGQLCHDDNREESEEAEQKVVRFDEQRRLLHGVDLALGLKVIIRMCCKEKWVNIRSEI